VTERLLIRGGRVIDPSAGLDRVADVVLAGGLVVRIDSDIEPESAKVIEASGCVVAPGFVDLHAHLREPGFEQKGTIATETLAALRGGFTTICAMPNTSPPPDSATEVESLLERFGRDSAVRVFSIGCVTRGRAGREVAELSELADAGCIAFSDDGNPVADSRLMRNALELASAIGLPISEHSDDPVLNGGGVMNEGRVSERLGLAGQPAAAEVTAIARNLALCEATGARLHIAHVTTARGVQMIAEAKERGLPVTCEVTPSHLFLNEDAVFGDGAAPAYETNAKINPPLRTEADRRALLAGVNSGVIDAIATDHAPHAREDKLCEFDRAAFGISCFDTALGTLLTSVQRGELDLLMMVRALTAGPVQSFRIGERSPGTGSLTLNRSADLVALDLDHRWIVDTSRFNSKGKNSPLGGQELTGAVKAVVFGGAVAFQREEVHA